MNNTKNTEYQILIIVTMISFLIRLYAFEFTYAINKDGILYINQAKAIFNGDWKLAQNCGYTFISLYHILIPVFYKIFGDWIIAAKSISLLFGTLAIIPFYLIARQLFCKSTSTLSSLAFSLNPFFVSNSVAVIRDPLFWFFALAGIFFFIIALNSKDKDYFLAFGSVFFLIGSLARLEIIIYYVGSVIFMLFWGNNKAKRVLSFNIPLFYVFIFTLLGLLIYNKDLNLWSMYLGPRFQHFFIGILDSFFNANFLQKSIAGFKLLMISFVKVSFLPFLPFLIAGVYSYKKEFYKNDNFSYLMLLSCLSFFALFFFYLKIEVLSSRYVALIMLPFSVFLGAGIKHTIELLKKKGFKEKSLIWVISIYILLFGIIPNLALKRADKLVYKIIGEHIATLGNGRPVKVMASDPRVMFYANLNTNEVECSYPIGYMIVQDLEYSDMVTKLKEYNTTYFLWDDKSWASSKYDFLAMANPLDFIKIDEWENKINRYVLFKVL